MNKRVVLWLAAAAMLGAVVVVGAFAIFGGADNGSAPRIADVSGERRSTIPADEEVEPEPAPEFSLPTMEGGEFRLSDYAGQVVVVNFWATWCAPCRVEIPELIEIQSELGGEGVQIVGISLDHDGREIVQEFAEEVGFNYPILLDDGEVATKFGGIYALPTTIIIDREGTIRRRISGIVTKNSLAPILAELTAS